MKILFLITLLITTNSVFAHTGHGNGISFQFGLLHPVTGLDHLLMLLGTGILARITGRILLLPLVTLSTILFSSIFSYFFDITFFAIIEFLIIISLLIIGINLLIESTLPLCIWLTPVFAIFHGWVHGSEIGLQDFWLFTIGVMVTSTILLYLGIKLGPIICYHKLIRKICGICIILSPIIIF